MEEKKAGDLQEEGGARPIFAVGEHPRPSDTKDGWPEMTVEELINGGG
jgi:hypothetical protein